MAKSQKRSSREAKKPKMKKDAVASSNIGSIARAASTLPLPKKKS